MVRWEVRSYPPQKLHHPGRLQEHAALHGHFIHEGVSQGPRLFLFQIEYHVHVDRMPQLDTKKSEVL